MPAPASSLAAQPESVDRSRPGRPRWLVPVVAVVGLLVVALVVVLVVDNRGGDAGQAAPPPVASTVVVPSPTPTVAPAARPATTAFAQSLPLTVLQYALASSQDDAEWVAAGALEAYTESFTDGGSEQVTVRAGQWETTDEARAFAASLTADDGSGAISTPDPSADPADALPQTGDVAAGGAAVGTYTIVDKGDGTGVAVWTNGQTVLQVTGPTAQIVDLYSAFPL